MKKYYIYILCISILFIGCEQFLDVIPKDQAYEEELFSERSGFESSLANVYSSYASQDLYGQEMKYGFLETLVGSYNGPSSSHIYYNAYQHFYEFPETRARIDKIWASHYQVINQLNLILKNIDRIKSDPYVNLIRGEALGLRAFSHFELLKLFGPVIKVEGLDAQAIPYKEKLEFVGVKAISAGEIIKKINVDLAESKALLLGDPIRENSSIADLNVNTYEKYNSLIDRRGIRLNYYAVVSLQALVAQWSGDQQAAGRFALEVIDELRSKNTIRLAKNLDFSTGLTSDRRFAVENIFGLYTVNLRESALRLLPELSDTRGNESPLLYPNYTWLSTNLYRLAEDGSANDYRLLNWFNQSSRWKFVKYYVNANLDRYLLADLFEVKLISLHDVYLVAAESFIKTNPAQAIALLNEARAARNIGFDIKYASNMDDEKLLSLIFSEFRKENIGEGTLFAAYKRLYRDIDRPTVIPVSTSLFKFPFPVDELTYNPTN